MYVFFLLKKIEKWTFDITLLIEWLFPDKIKISKQINSLITVQCATDLHAVSDTCRLHRTQTSPNSQLLKPNHFKMGA